MAYIRPLKIILTEKTTELVLLLHKNKTSLVFLWPNVGQKPFQVLTLRTMLGNIQTNLNETNKNETNLNETNKNTKPNYYL